MRTATEPKVSTQLDVFTPFHTTSVHIASYLITMPPYAKCVSFCVCVCVRRSSEAVFALFGVSSFLVFSSEFQVPQNSTWCSERLVRVCVDVWLTRRSFVTAVE